MTVETYIKAEVLIKEMNDLRAITADPERGNGHISHFNMDLLKSRQLALSDEAIMQAMKDKLARLWSEFEAL